MPAPRPRLAALGLANQRLANDDAAADSEPRFHQEEEAGSGPDHLERGSGASRAGGSDGLPAASAALGGVVHRESVASISRSDKRQRTPSMTSPRRTSARMSRQGS